MAEWTGVCNVEHARRPGWSRCKAECATCALVNHLVQLSPREEPAPEHATDRQLTSIETYSGLYFDFADPQPDQVALSDIAHALAMTRRFGGHTSRFYSVAEHAVRVSRSVLGAGGTDLQQFAALHHDDHEAYMGDWPTPLKRALPIEVVSEMEDRCDRVIATVLGISQLRLHDPMIKEHDQVMRGREASSLLKSRGCSAFWGSDTVATQLPADSCWKWQRAEAEFLALHTRLEYLIGASA